MGRFALAGNYNAARDGTYAQSPIPDFDGTFQGLGNKIDNFSLNLTQMEYSTGLFGIVGGTVQNLHLTNVSVSAAQAPTNEIMGALAGTSGTLRRDTVSGVVQGNSSEGVADKVGGLVGKDFGSVIGCASNALVTDAGWTGGLVGYMIAEGGTPQIANSIASGHVSGRGNTGGLVGAAVGGGTILNSFATADVDRLSAPVGGNVGGLVGDNETVSILSSFASGNVSGGPSTQGAGGLVGANSGLIQNSYTTGAVEDAPCDYCGGLIGENSGEVTASYSVGAVKPGGGVAAGGLIGFDSYPAGSLKQSYWDIDTSGREQGIGRSDSGDMSGVTGLTDPQLKAALPAGFDPKVWGQNPNINNGYPYLLANPPPKT